MNCSLMTRAERTRTPSQGSYENDVHIKCTNAHRDTNIKTCVFMVSASPKLTGDKNKNGICKWQRPTGWRRQRSSSPHHPATVDANHVTEKEEDAVSGIDTVNRHCQLSVSNEHTQCIHVTGGSVSSSDRDAHETESAETSPSRAPARRVHARRGVAQQDADLGQEGAFLSCDSTNLPNCRATGSKTPESIKKIDKRDDIYYGKGGGGVKAARNDEKSGKYKIRVNGSVDVITQFMTNTRTHSNGEADDEQTDVPSPQLTILTVTSRYGNRRQTKRGGRRVIITTWRRSHKYFSLMFRNKRKSTSGKTARDVSAVIRDVNATATRPSSSGESTNALSPRSRRVTDLRPILPVPPRDENANLVTHGALPTIHEIPPPIVIYPVALEPVIQPPRHSAARDLASLFDAISSGASTPTVSEVDRAAATLHDAIMSGQARHDLGIPYNTTPSTISAPQSVASVVSDVTDGAATNVTPSATNAATNTAPSLTVAGAGVATTSTATGAATGTVTAPIQPVTSAATALNVRVSPRAPLFSAMSPQIPSRLPMPIRPATPSLRMTIRAPTAGR